RSDLQTGDRLLLCGNFHALNQASSWIAPPVSPSEPQPLVQIPLASISEAVPELLSSDGQ
ncbi:MAG TPA: hypothetical protein V6C65_32495, partial [Allocoleopsis sp.]